VSEARDPQRRLAWRIGIGVAAAAVAVGIAVVVVRGHEGERWSTDSEVARGELEAGRRALDKLYVNEAIDHFLAAEEADPDFLAPKVLLLRHGSSVAGGRERLDGLIDELRGADLDRVTPRERLLVRHTLALVDRRPDEARRLVDDYLADEPEDPWAVELRCGHAWGDDEWAAAKDCYRRLIELDPNRVEAQNRIGYMEMAEGHFDEAAAQFQIYGFLAPDQANPHDSMGELMLLTGRYDEAEAELRQALALKPDFCASWLNLVLLHELRHDFDGAEAVVADAAGACPEASLAKMRCSIGLWRNADAGRWSAAWDAANGCGDWPADLDMAYFAAGAAGRLDETAPLLDRLRQEAAAMAGDGGKGDAKGRPWLENMAAVRAWFDGDPESAAAHGRAADAALSYWSGQWLFKLQNRRLTAAALEASGRGDEAAALRRQIRQVNPHLADDPPFPWPAAPPEAP